MLENISETNARAKIEKISTILSLTIKMTLQTKKATAVAFFIG